MTIKGPKFVKDKGYSWLIVFTSFLSHFCNIGFSYGVGGNLTIAHQDFFKVDLQQGSLIGTVHIGVLFLFGPVTSILVKKLGCRFTEIFGGSLLLLGLGLSVLSSQLWHAIILYGILAGMGISCCYTASSQILAVYFDRLKYLAFSLAALGIYVGLMTWPILSQFLLNKFGYSYAMGIMASAHLLHIIAGISFFEPKEEDLEGMEDNSEVDSYDKPKQPIDANFGSDNLAMEFSPEDFARDNNSMSESSVSETSSDMSIVSMTPDLKTDFIALLKSWKIWLFIISGMLWNINSAGFLIFLNDYIIQNTNMDKDEAALGVTIIGIANIVGCVSVILTSSLKFNRFLLYFCAITFFAAATIATAFTNSKEMYYSLAVCYGLGQSITITCILGVVTDLCTASQIPLLFGLKLFPKGIGGMGVLPLAAFIGEATGERYGIIFVGCCGILGALTILPVVVLKLMKGKTTANSDDSSE